MRLRDKGKDWIPPDFEKAITKGRKRLEKEGQIKPYFIKQVIKACKSEPQ